MGSGYQKICKALGSIKINGELFVWDYVADKAVPEKEMPLGSERHAASERRRYELHKQSSDIEGGQ